MEPIENVAMDSHFRNDKVAAQIAVQTADQTAVHNGKLINSSV